MTDLARAGDRIVWRLRCYAFGTPGHRGHAYAVSDRNTKTAETRAALVADRNADPVMSSVAYRDCRGWVIEAQYVGPWTVDLDDVFDAMDVSPPRVADEQGTLL